MSLLHLLTDDDLKELIPLLGERKRIQIALLKITPTIIIETTSSENIVFILLKYTICASCVVNIFNN